MSNKPETFAHVLLFACPECARPLAFARASSKQNLEDAEAHWFNPHCHCGWRGEVMGIEAVQHWVQAWERGIPAGENVPRSGEATF
jgi:hypothetical protein